MQKRLFLLSLFTATLLNAQVDPLDQFFNKSFIPSLVEYDSISVSLDSGSNFSTIATASQHYFTNGNIDTLIITQMGVPMYTYDGTLSGRTTTIIGSDIATSNILDKMVFSQDSLFRDSAIAYYAYNGSTYQLFFEAVVNYTLSGGNNVDYLDIYADLGTGLTKVGTYTYFYQGSYLDSVFYTISMGSMGDGYLKYQYDPNNPSKQLGLETYEDVDNNGERDLVQRLVFDHNILNQVVQITEFNLDNNNNLTLTGEYRYSTQKNSTISLAETGKVEVSLYPNPAYNYLQIDFDKEVFTDFAIHSLSGQQVLSGVLQNRLDIQSLPSGVYILSLSGQKSHGQVTFEKL